MLVPVQRDRTTDSSFNKLYPIIEEYVKDFPSEFRKIPEGRRYRLNEIVYYLENNLKSNQPMQLLFIDADQSVNSQMAQVWSETAAYYFGYNTFESYSGGIDQKSIEEKTITSMEKAGFIIYKSNVGGLDVYRVKYSYNLEPIVAFPKKTDHVKNPYQDFMVVGLDGVADQNLSKIKGTYNRLFLDYDKEMNGQDYEATCKEIAVEMFYVFAQLRRRTKSN